MQLRTYRAHGRIDLYMNSLCHTEMILTDKEQIVLQPEETVVLLCYAENRTVFPPAFKVCPSDQVSSPQISEDTLLYHFNINSPKPNIFSLCYSSISNDDEDNKITFFFIFIGPLHFFSCEFLSKSLSIFNCIF